MKFIAVIFITWNMSIFRFQVSSQEPPLPPVPAWLEEVGTTSSGKTFFISLPNVTSHWLGAQFELLKWSYSPTIGLAAIESEEETALLDQYFYNIYGNSSGEYVWTSGTSLGTPGPYDTNNVKWSTTGGYLSDIGYTHFYPRVTLYPNGLLNWVACVAGQYTEFNYPYTFFWRYAPCTDQYRFLIQHTY